MNILEAIKKLRDDIKAWVTNNLNAINTKIDQKTVQIDDKLDSTSTNPVQNKVVAEEVNKINQAIENVQTGPVNYTDVVGAPDIHDDQSGEMVVADPEGNIVFKVDESGITSTGINSNGDELTIEDGEGNIIFKVDADGLHTTNINGSPLITKEYVDEQIANVGVSEELENKVEEIEGKLNNGFGFTENGLEGLRFDAWDEEKIAMVGYIGDNCLNEALMIHGPSVKIRAMPTPNDDFGIVAIDGRYVEIGNGCGDGEPLAFSSTAIENYFTGKVSFYGEVESESITNQINAATNSLKEELGLNEAIEATTVTIEELVRSYIDFNFDNGDEEEY